MQYCQPFDFSTLYTLKENVCHLNALKMPGRKRNLFFLNYLEINGNHLGNKMQDICLTLHILQSG